MDGRLTSPIRQRGRGDRRRLLICGADETRTSDRGCGYAQTESMGGLEPPSDRGAKCFKALAGKFDGRQA